MKFKTSSGIKSIVGKDLITDRYVAIFELVKNSYDARATEVIVSFNTSNDSAEGIGSLDDGKIYIVDNGVGMSKDDLDNKWLRLAYSDKQEGSLEEEDADKNSFREIKNRVLVGSKGIGRFSSDSLGSVITIRTKVNYENIEHQLTVNWDDFDRDLKTLFEDVSVEYKESSQLSRSNIDSYTIIEISNLRNSWTEEQLDGVTEKLRRLKNPFIEDDDLDIYCGVNIFILNQKYNLNKSNLIYSNIANVLKEKSINITASINRSNEGEYKTTIALHDRGNLVYIVEKSDDSILTHVDEIEISVNYLTTSAKSTFTRRMGIQPVNYGNIFVYRNGFHVSPYGEEHYDIFGLNLRKNQGYSRYLATRELIGFISIKDSKNLFKETSSRSNGFIENGYFKTLEEFYMDFIQRPLERYVQLINWGEIKKSGKEVHLEDVDIKDNEKNNFKKYISRDNFKVLSFNSELDFEKNKPEKIIERISESINNPKPDKNKLDDDTKTLSKQIRDLKKENTETGKKAVKTERKADLLEAQNKNLVEKRDGVSYGEQITHHFTILAENLDYALDDLLDIKNNIQESDKEKFLSAIEGIRSTKLEMEVFRYLLLGTNFDLKAPDIINWYEITDWYLNKGGRRTYYDNFKSSCNIVANEGNEWLIDSSHTDLVMMIENFYRNAFEHGASFIDFTYYENHIEITSDSELIDESLVGTIFELGFSTKKNGTGIGLSQVRSFLLDNDFQVTAKNTNNLVCFTISK
ncbi:ATP-binding protein [Psychrobacter glaciei]|uniref:ATP-binding protein n=1 Tax=Psychrobacter glaciei TaxID=619771 RepID=UPI003F474617